MSLKEIRENIPFRSYKSNMRTEIYTDTYNNNIFDITNKNKYLGELEG